MEALITGLLNLLNINSLSLLFLGSLIGLVIGIIPGLGGVFAMSVLMPFTFDMPLVSAFAFLLGIYASTSPGGVITAILLNTPGTGSNAASLMDGFPMTQQGHSGRALGAALTASAVGGVFGAIVLALIIPVMRPLVLAFGNPEFFMLVLVGILFIGLLGTDSVLKGLVAGGLGLLVSLIGYDPVTGITRFDLGIISLFDGIHLVAVAVGLFAVAEMLYLGIKGGSIAETRPPKISRDILDGILDVFRYWNLTLRSSVLGTIIGIIPGLGGDVATFIAYGHARQVSKTPSEFGKGNIEGVIAPNAADNSKEGGSLVPTLGFGVPGSAAMAVLLGAFMIHGIIPGSDMLTTYLPLTFSMAWSIAIANIFVAIVGLGVGGVLGKLAFVRGSIIIPLVLAFAAMGSFAVRSSWVDIVAMALFGLLGLGLKIYNYPRAAVLLGVVLGRIFEINFHLSLQIFGWTFFLTRPIALILLLIVVIMIISQVRERRKGLVVHE